MSKRVTEKNRKSKNPQIQKGTIAIVASFNGASPPRHLGVVLRPTVGKNWYVNTFGGNFIYDEHRIHPLMETDGKILSAKKVWQKFSLDILQLLLQNQKF